MSKNQKELFRKSLWITVLWEMIELASLNTELISLFMVIIIIVGIVLVIYYLKYSRDKFTQKFGAPNYETALKVSEGLFPSYSIYLEAQKRQAENYHQYNVTERYKVNSYPLAFKIASGKFPTHEAYQFAINERYSNYLEWTKKQQLKKALVSLIQRAESVHRDDFMTVMGFSNSQQFMDWIMKLPDYSPFILKGDVITFHKSRSQSFEELVNDTLCHIHNPQYQGLSRSSDEPRLEPVYLADLSEEQRQIMDDLRKRKAIPQSQMIETFQVKEIEIVPTVQSYIPEGEFIIRIEDLYRMVKPTHFCQLCQKSTNNIPYFQCKSCNRYLCQGHYTEINQLGYPSCPECSGELSALPIKCRGCGITYLDWSNMKNHVMCQFCNYQLEYPEISSLQSRSLSKSQIQENSQIKEPPSQSEGLFCFKCGSLLDAKKVCPKCTKPMKEEVFTSLRKEHQGSMTIIQSLDYISQNIKHDTFSGITIVGKISTIGEDNLSPKGHPFRRVVIEDETKKIPIQIWGFKRMRQLNSYDCGDLIIIKNPKRPMEYHESQGIYLWVHENKSFLNLIKQ